MVEETVAATCWRQGAQNWVHNSLNRHILMAGITSITPKRPVREWATNLSRSTRSDPEQPTDTPSSTSGIPKTTPTRRKRQGTSHLHQRTVWRPVNSGTVYWPLRKPEDEKPNLALSCTVSFHAWMPGCSQSFSNDTLWQMEMPLAVWKLDRVIGTLCN